MKNIILLIGFFFFSLNVLAHSETRCLNQVSDQALLDEVRDRMGNSSGGRTYSLLTVSCLGSRMSISLVSSGGQESSAEMSSSSSSLCSDHAAQISGRIGNKVHQAELLVTCLGSRMKRVKVSNDGIIEKLSDLSLSSSSDCEAQASFINQSED